MRQPNENVFAEFLAELKSKLDEQDQEKLEQLRTLLAAAKPESFPAFDRIGIGNYVDGRK